MMRPDEQANAAEVQRDQRMRQGIGKGIGIAVGLASGSLGARALPFLNEYIPTDLAMKGLQKVSPQIASFLKKGQSAGLDIKEGMQYVKDKLMPKEEEKQEAQQDKRNLIEKHSPELHQFISQHIKKGKSHKEAGALARIGTGGKSFDKVIDKLTKEHKTTWEDILESVYGGAKSANSAGNVAQNPADMTGNAQQQQQGQPQQGQSGPGQQALMDVLNRINQKMGQ
jgi:hypothetical protein